MSEDDMERRQACAVDELAPGTSMTLPGDVPIAVYRNDAGDYYATADTCSHEQWSLGEDSDLEGNEVTCPLHMARFDIATGRPLCLPATLPIQTYEVVIEEGEVYVLA